MLQLLLQVFRGNGKVLVKGREGKGGGGEGRVRLEGEQEQTVE